MVLITIKRSDGSVEKRHLGDGETSIRDIIVSRYLGSTSGRYLVDDDVVEIMIEKIEHALSDKETK